MLSKSKREKENSLKCKTFLKSVKTLENKDSSEKTEPEHRDEKYEGKDLKNERSSCGASAAN